MEKKERPKTLAGETTRIATGCGNMYVQVNFLETEMFEVFATLGKAGGCAKAQCEGVSRLITLALRCGIPVEFLIEELENIKCPSIAYDEEGEVKSCPDAMAKVMKGYLEEKVEEVKNEV